MSVIWIDSAQALQDFTRRAQGQTLAVDTESDHFHAYRPRVCLIQVATSSQAALVDPLALSAQELAPLMELLSDPAVPKILHACRSDMVELHRDFGVRVRHVFDTQIAARFLAYERQSLSWLQETLLGVVPGQQFQKFDWTTRPIPEGARRYALDDVVHLFALRERLEGELSQSGWREAFEQTCTWASDTAMHRPSEFDREGWRRIKTPGPLGPRERAALQELFAWRHEVCQRINRAALFVVDNANLLKLAQTRPTSPQELASTRIRLNVATAETKAMLEAIAHSLTIKPPPERPAKVYSDTALTPEEDACLRRLKQWRDQNAESLKIPAEFLASNAVLAATAQARPQTLEALGRVHGLLDWHVERFGQPLLALVAGRSAS